MNEQLHPRQTRSGQAAAGRDDPLAELARIVGADDPFANLFSDARRKPAAGRRAEPAFEADRPELRGAYHDEDEELRPAPLPRARYEDDQHDEYGRHYDEGDDAADSYEAYAEDYAADEPEEPQAERRAKPRGVLVKSAAVIGLVVIGGGALMAWKSNGFHGGSLPGLGGQPPVIAAGDQPVKIKPDVVASADAKPEAKEIFDRATSEKPSSADKVMPREELPVALAATEPQATRPAAVAPAGNAWSAADSPSERDPASTEPRRVKTVKVLADGTVVTGEAPAPAPLQAGAGGVASLVESDNGDSATAAIPHISASAPLPGADDAERPATPQVAMADLDGPVEKATDAVPDAGSAITSAAADSAASPAQAAPTVTPPARPKAAAVAKPKPAADASVTHVPAAQSPATKPMQMASLTTNDGPAAASTGGGAWVVQLASQRSQADAMATFQSIAKKYPGVLGGMKPSIKQADLGDKGTYFRVRVGSYASRDEATALCMKLKAAGGTCVVSRS
jgi:cell division septation protein DedD